MDDPAADITDVYAWLQNSQKINLVMNVHPFANTDSRFSDGVKYVFHVNNAVGYGETKTETNVICTFSTDQKITCKAGGKTIIDKLDASATAGVSNEDGTFKVFAGLRNDPFFFDLNNFNATRTTVRDAAGSLTFDGAGCPTLDTPTRTLLVSTLTGGETTPADTFAGSNTLSIVVQIDRTLVKGTGAIYSTWASTHR
jgi:hypothetical protein